METTNQVCLLQSLVGVAGGATRAALTVHQARRDNMADISAKDGSQVLFFYRFFLTCDLCCLQIVYRGANRVYRGLFPGCIHVLLQFNYTREK